MASGQWCWTGPNPIERAAIGIEFSAPFSQEAVAMAALSHRKLRSTLPRRVDHYGWSVAQGVGQPVPLPLGPPGQRVGFAFDRTNDVGVQVKSLSLVGNLLTFTSADYTRWTDVWAEAKSLFREVLPPLIAAGGAATSLTLEYVNQLFFNGDAEAADVASALRRGPFVPENAFDVQSLWHSFHGFFRERTENPFGRHLENINVTLKDGRPPNFLDVERDTRGLEIVLNHKFMFLAPVFLSVESNLDDRGSIILGPQLTSMHERNKAILRDVLADAIISRIPGLDAVR